MISDADLAAIVRQALDDPTAEPAGHRTEPVDHGATAMTTASVDRLHGTTIDGREWSVFVKVAQAVRHWPHYEQIPPGVREVIARTVPWRLEADAHRSDLRERVPDGMRLPRCYRIDELGDDRVAMWLEWIDVDAAGWDLARYERVAHLLGRLAARRLPDRVAPLSPVSAVHEHGEALRFYLEHRVTGMAVPVIRAGPTPAIASVLADLGEQRLYADLLDLHDAAPALIETLDALPQTYVHGDACPQNLLMPRGAPDEVVAIDWGFNTPQAIGFDLGQLLIGHANDGIGGPTELAAIDAVIAPAYVDGLAAEGMPVSMKDVRTGYVGSLLARSLWTSLPFEQGPADHLARRARLTRFLADLATTV